MGSPAPLAPSPVRPGPDDDPASSQGAGVRGAGPASPDLSREMPKLRHVWPNVGAWNLISWWHRLVSCGCGTGRRPACATGATRRGTSRGVAHRTPIAVRSSVARRCGRNIRACRRWRACARKSAGSFGALCGGLREVDSSGKVQHERTLEETQILLEDCQQLNRKDPRPREERDGPPEFNLWWRNTRAAGAAR